MWHPYISDIDNETGFHIRNVLNFVFMLIIHEVEEMRSVIDLGEYRTVQVKRSLC